MVDMTLSEIRTEYENISAFKYMTETLVATGEMLKEKAEEMFRKFKAERMKIVRELTSHKEEWRYGAHERYKKIIFPYRMTKEEINNYIFSEYIYTDDWYTTEIKVFPLQNKTVIYHFQEKTEN